MTARRGASGPDIRSMLAVALMAALIAAASQIQIPLPPVPINLALLPVFLAGFALPGRQALFGVGLFLLMGAVGLPVFSGFRGGPAALFGPTGGYLLGYLLACGTVLLLHKYASNTPKCFFICIIALLACYVPGTLWLSFVTPRPVVELLPVAVLPFLPGDALKCVAAALLTPSIKKIIIHKLFTNRQ